MPNQPKETKPAKPSTSTRVLTLCSFDLEMNESTEASRRRNDPSAVPPHLSDLSEFLRSVARKNHMKEYQSDDYERSSNSLDVATAKWILVALIDGRNVQWVTYPNGQGKIDIENFGFVSVMGCMDMGLEIKFADESIDGVFGLRYTEPDGTSKPVICFCKEGILHVIVALAAHLVAYKTKKLRTKQAMDYYLKIPSLMNERFAKEAKTFIESTFKVDTKEFMDAIASDYHHDLVKCAAQFELVVGLESRDGHIGLVPECERSAENLACWKLKFESLTNTTSPVTSEDVQMAQMGEIKCMVEFEDIVSKKEAYDVAAAMEHQKMVVNTFQDQVKNENSKESERLETDKANRQKLLQRQKDKCEKFLQREKEARGELLESQKNCREEFKQPMTETREDVFKYLGDQDERYLNVVADQSKKVIDLHEHNSKPIDDREAFTQRETKTQENLFKYLGDQDERYSKSFITLVAAQSNQVTDFQEHHSKLLVDQDERDLKAVTEMNEQNAACMGAHDERTASLFADFLKSNEKFSTKMDYRRKSFARERRLRFEKMMAKSSAGKEEMLLRHQQQLPHSIPLPSQSQSYSPSPQVGQKRARNSPFSPSPQVGNMRARNSPYSPSPQVGQKRARNCPPSAPESKDDAQSSKRKRLFA